MFDFMYLGLPFTASIVRGEVQVEPSTKVKTANYDEAVGWQDGAQIEAEMAFDKVGKYYPHEDLLEDALSKVLGGDFLLGNIKPAKGTPGTIY